MRRARYLFTPTPRQRDVLRLVACGLTNPQIACALGMSYYRVRDHISALLLKAGVKERHALALYAWRNGVIGIDEAWDTLQQHTVTEGR